MHRFLTGRTAATGFGAALLVLSTLIVYANSLPSDFVWDDFAVVVSRIESSGISDIPGLFLERDSIGNVGAPYYRPLNLSTYLVDAFFYGNHAAGFHLTNVAIHVLSVMALYLASIALFGRTDLALVASLLFAVHPVNTEAVNAICARNTILAALFVLLSLWVYVEHEKAKSVRLLLLSAALYLLGLLCKETAAMLVVVLALYERVAWNRSERFAVLAARLLPFAASIALYLALRTIALSGALGLDLAPGRLVDRLSPNLAIVPMYLGLILWPVELSLIRKPPAGGFPVTLWTLASWVAIAGVVALLWRTRRPATRLGLFWFAVNYVPISNLVFIPSAPVAERYLYLPAVGIWWLVADQLLWLYERVSAKRLVALAAVGVLAALGCRSVVRNLDWRSSVSLFQHEVKINPFLAENHYNLCTGYLKAGQTAQAESACLRAEELDPRNPDVLTQLGYLQQVQQRYALARDYYQRAIDADRSHVKARYNLAHLLEYMGKPAVAFHHYLALEKTLPPDHFLRADVESRLHKITANLAAEPKPR